MLAVREEDCGVWVKEGEGQDPFTELGKMVDAGLGGFSCGQAEMTSW